MVQKATPSARRGRPPKFDADHVVDAAIGAFFDKGFEATTLTDLEVATGVDRSTLYNSFGGKNGLYHEATKRYLDHAANGLFSVLHNGDDGIGDIVTFMEGLGSGLTSQAVSPGCLIVNDMAAGSDPEAARRYRALLEDGMRAALGRAVRAGQIDPSTVESRTALISAAVIGINLISGHTGDNSQVEQLVAGTLAEINSWHNSPR